jgi:hypothetical protein
MGNSTKVRNSEIRNAGTFTCAPILGAVKT